MFEQRRAHLVHVDQYIQTHFDEPLDKKRVAEILRIFSEEKYQYKGKDQELLDFSGLLSPGFIDKFFSRRKGPKQNESFKQVFNRFVRLVVFVELYKQLMCLKTDDQLGGKIVGHLLLEVDALIPLAKKSFDCMYILDYFHRINNDFFEGDERAKPYTAIRAIIRELTPIAIAGLKVPSLVGRNIIYLEEALHYFFKDLQKDVEKLPYRKRLKIFQGIVLVVQSAPEVVKSSDRAWIQVVHRGLMAEYEASKMCCTTFLFEMAKEAAKVTLVVGAVVVKYLYWFNKVCQQFLSPELQQSYMTLELPCALLWCACVYGAYNLHTQSKGPASLRSPGELPDLGQNQKDQSAERPLMRAR